MRRRRKRIYWPSLTTKEKTRALQRILAFKRNRNATGEDVRRDYFRGVTRSGLITHCWRHGPSLPNAKVLPQKSTWRAGK